MGKSKPTASAPNRARPTLPTADSCASSATENRATGRALHRKPATRSLQHCRKGIKVFASRGTYLHGRVIYCDLETESGGSS
jgi:hypothetical protein